eukprot:2599111-Pyramimonas_sp.AAC.1
MERRRGLIKLLREQRGPRPRRRHSRRAVLFFVPPLRFESSQKLKLLPPKVAGPPVPPILKGQGDVTAVESDGGS